MIRLSRGRHFKHLIQKAIALIVGAMLLYKSAIAFIERDPSIEVIIDKSNNIDINRIFNTASRDHLLFVPDRANYLNNNKNEYKIPRILLQFWDTSRIPTDFEEWIHSWIFRHPDWEDLDVEALRPIDAWLEGPHNCFLSLENFEHAYFHYEAEDPVVMNTFFFF